MLNQEMQSIEQTAAQLGISVSNLFQIRIDPDLHFPKPVKYNGKIKFSPQLVKRQQEDRIDECNPL